MRNIKIIALFLVGLLALSCQGDDSGEGKATTPELSEEFDLEIDLVDNKWVYISLVDNVVIGTSDFNDEGDDAQWFDRKDWDIAFCNGYIRLNSGSSGEGAGGILVSEEEFEEMNSAPDQGYSADFVQH